MRIIAKNKDMGITNQYKTARDGNITVMRITVKIEYMRCMYVCMYVCIPNLRTSFRLNSERIIPMILEIKKPIFRFLNRIPILVKDASNITERLYGIINLPYEVKVAESIWFFKRTENWRVLLSIW
jgi:hypothetical protein